MWQSIVRKQMRYNRNMDVRRKVVLFFEADKLGNVVLACKKLGYKRSYYYYWFNRLKAADYNIKSLEKLSSKPHSHPNTTPTDKVNLIKQLRKQTRYGPERIAYYLQKDHGITMAPSTIGHVLKREGLIQAQESQEETHQALPDAQPGRPSANGRQICALSYQGATLLPVYRHR